MSWERGRGMGFGGFSMDYSASGGSTASNYMSRESAIKTQKEKEKEYYALQGMSLSGIGKKRHFDEDESLEEDDELEYQPAPESPNAEINIKNENESDDDDDDPLDAYMAGVEVQAKKDKEMCETHEIEDPSMSDKTDKKLGRTDIDQEDMQESYFRWLEENKANTVNDDDEEIEYDEEGNPIYTWKKIIDPLPPIDHSKVNYEPFERNFYIPHKDIESLNHTQLVELRNKLGIKATGLNPPKPVSSFAHFGFDEQLMSAIRKAEYSQPTPIQAQAIPAALGGRDIIGIAKTGSGKTVAYLWPALVHLMAQRELEENEGPIVLIVVPTRELAIQVYNEAKRFGKVYNINVVCTYGGGSKWEQTKALAQGAEIIVATPGRLIDMVKIAATNLTRVTYVVFDEADRMFDLGFEPQVRSIANHVRADRQCMLFSATFKKKVERLARDVLSDPVRIVQGEVGEANEDIIQTVEVLPAGPAKWTWLLERLVSFSSLGKVLIFVTKKQNSEELANSLRAKDFNLVLLHGDMLQYERNEVIHSFRKENVPILVATDVAARGLDIPQIKTVVNYDVARDIDTHIHRIGRTGRAGEKGWAYTLVTDKDNEFAGHLVRNLETVNQTVPQKLMDLAMQSSWFRSNRFKEGKSAKPGIGGRGLGYKQRPALGNVKNAPMTSSTSGASRSFQAAVATGANAGAAGSRLAAMKAAFQTSFKSTFQAAATADATATPTDPIPDWKKQLEEQNKANQTPSSHERRKKSRWN